VAWQAQVRKYADAKDWASATRVVDEAIRHAPGDMDVREWRARVLTWSEHLREAELEYLAILRVSRKDPDKWMGLAGVYLREGKSEEAVRALSTAVELDPKRADLRAARARALRADGQQNEARKEFQAALNLDAHSEEARAGLLSLRDEPKHELRFGNENDLFNFAGPNHDEWTSLTSQWTPHWATNATESVYERGGVNADKFLASVTVRQPKAAAVSIGGAVGHDNAVIPKSEAFFDLDHGWKTGDARFVRAVEISYGQHWYWYQASRILTLNNTIVVYLPREWMLTLGATGARSAFSGTDAEWRPSGSARLAFPLAARSAKRLSAYVLYAAGTENFGQVDQIGSFASQTYSSGLRFQFNARQEVTGLASYQRRTQDRTDLTFGFSYGLHF
jgi:tetratricopeptide (TPR) repeat protein